MRYNIFGALKGGVLSLLPLLLLLISFSSCSNQRDTLDRLRDGGSYEVYVNFESADFEEVNVLRSHLDEIEERKMDTILYFVFKSDGSPVNGADGKQVMGTQVVNITRYNPNKMGNPTNKGGLLGLVLDSKVGDQIVFAMTNLTSNRYTLFYGNSPLYSLDEASNLLAGKKLDDIKKGVTVKFLPGQESLERFKTFKYGEVSVKQTSLVEDKPFNVMMRPIDVKVSFRLKTDATVANRTIALENVEWRVVNAPKQASFVGASSTNAADYFSSDLVYASEDYTASVVTGVRGDFYLLPMSHAPQKKIDVTGALGYHERQRYQKDVNGTIKTANGVPLYEYAPQLATSINIKANLGIRYTNVDPAQVGAVEARRAEVNYNIVLGDFSDLSNKDNINSYSLAGGHHYTYNIIVKDVDKIVVEVTKEGPTADNNFNEVQPGAEGRVIDYNKFHLLDCHYDQVPLHFNVSSLGLPAQLNSGGLWEIDKTQDKPIRFTISTPFTPLTTVEATFTKLVKAKIDANKGSGVTLEEAKAFTEDQWVEALNTVTGRLKNFIPGGTLPDKNGKKVDSKWIQMYIHPSFGVADIASNNMELYTYAAHDNEIYSLEETLLRLYAMPSKVFTNAPFITYGRTLPVGTAKFTVFLDEYAYEKNPLDGSGPVHWAEYCNKPARKFAIVLQDEKTSLDGRSSYNGVILSIEQVSIKTIFSREMSGIRAWGVETFDETKDLYWAGRTYFDGAGDTYQWRTNSFFRSNGWNNTWMLMASGSATDVAAQPVQGAPSGAILAVAQEPMTLGLRSRTRFQITPDKPEENGGLGFIWTKYIVTDEARGKLKLNWKFSSISKGVYGESDYNNDNLTNHNAYVMLYGGLLRNRDNGGADLGSKPDGMMQHRELKWYIPSVEQMSLLQIYDSQLPVEARLNNINPQAKSAEDIPTIYFTSTARSGFIMQYRSSADPIVYHSGSGRFVPLDFVFQFHGLRPMGKATFMKNAGGWFTEENGKRLASTGTRFVRDLGVITNEELTSEHKAKMGYEVLNSVNNSLQDRVKNRIIRLDHLNPAGLRSHKMNRELPIHNELSIYAKPYKKGFMVAQKPAPKLDRYPELKTDEKTFAEEWFNASFQELQMVINMGHSPCRYYSEKPDGSDKGTWRIPNREEMLLMLNDVTDWYGYEAQYTGMSESQQPTNSHFAWQNWNVVGTNHSFNYLLHTMTGVSGTSEDIGYKRHFVGFVHFADRFLIQSVSNYHPEVSRSSIPDQNSKLDLYSLLLVDNKMAGSADIPFMVGDAVKHSGMLPYLNYDGRNARAMIVRCVKDLD